MTLDARQWPQARHAAKLPPSISVKYWRQGKGPPGAVATSWRATRGNDAVKYIKASGHASSHDPTRRGKPARRLVLIPCPAIPVVAHKNFGTKKKKPAAAPSRLRAQAPDIQEPASAWASARGVGRGALGLAQRRRRSLLHKTHLVLVLMADAVG